LVAKIIFLLAVFVLTLAGDISKWNQARRRDKLLYAAMIVPAVYPAVIFVTEAPLPNLDELFRIFFFAPAHRIVSLFEPPSS
jgi:hypothetical protein